MRQVTGLQPACLPPAPQAPPLFQQSHPAWRPHGRGADTPRTSWKPGLPLYQVVLTFNHLGEETKGMQLMKSPGFTWHKRLSPPAGGDAQGGEGRALTVLGTLPSSARGNRPLLCLSPLPTDSTPAPDGRLLIRRCAGSFRPSARWDRAVSRAPGPPGPGWDLCLVPGPWVHLCECFPRRGDLQVSSHLFPADTERLR